jgi:hypothetical protein
MQSEGNVEQQNQNVTSAKQPEKDSLGMDVKKSPWLLFALLQIPIVIGMLILIYFMYQNAGGGNN